MSTLLIAALIVVVVVVLIVYKCYPTSSRSKVVTLKDGNTLPTDVVYDKDGGYAGYKDCYFDQKKYYPELDIITENFEAIREELFSIREKRPEMWHEWIAGELKVFPILFFEKWAKIAEELCPVTTNIIKSIPGVKTASFSCLSPGKQIQPHKGWGDLANNILRCHFGVDVPDDCGCVCDNWVVKHKTGEWLVFDDSRMHSSYNMTDKLRFILIIDMPRPPQIPKGTSTVKYGDNLMEFIQSFYDADDASSMKKGLALI